jgi:hypothetical protein
VSNALVGRYKQLQKISHEQPNHLICAKGLRFWHKRFPHYYKEHCYNPYNKELLETTGLDDKTQYLL